VTAVVDPGRAELDAARTRLALTRAAYAELLAAARAAIAADRIDAGTDPLGWVRGVLADHGQLPPDGADPVQVVADARSALVLTGWTS
jgi:hypothetical protein